MRSEFVRFVQFLCQVSLGDEIQSLLGTEDGNLVILSLGTCFV